MPSSWLRRGAVLNAPAPHLTSTAKRRNHVATANPLGVGKMIEGKAKLAVKLPIELDQWIEKQAEMEERSKNAIVVRALRAVKQAQEKAPAQ
jgi:hypothetical protein